MNTTLVLDPMFQTVGLVSFCASFMALACSLGHAVFYWRQRTRQPDEFMRGLACRMKALFVVLSLMLLLHQPPDDKGERGNADAASADEP